MKVFALYNMKGGVGKTTSAVNLAYLSAVDGTPTLLWDLDPQASATFYLRIEPKLEGGGRRLVLGESEAEPRIRGSDFDHLDVLPADFSCRKLESALASVDDAHRRLRDTLAPLEEEYDHVFLDCVPNVSRLSEAVLSLADVLLIPTIPTTLSLRALARQMAYLEKRKKRGFRPLPFLTMVDRRKSMHRSVTEWITGQDVGFLETSIPYSSVAERMGIHRAPIDRFARQSRPARAYRDLWREIVTCTSEPDRQHLPLYRRTTRDRLEEIAKADPSHP